MTCAVKANLDAADTCEQAGYSQTRLLSTRGAVVHQWFQES
jgi:hypothetical protein